MTAAPVTERLDFALQAVEAAMKFIMGYYQAADLEVERKRDRTPVTAADRGAEELLRREIARVFPHDAVLGEEYGESSGTSGFRWILDPIDGTKSFIHGVPLFGTLIGLEDQRENPPTCVMGVCAFPALNEVVYAARGQGAWWRRGNADPRSARVSQVSELKEAAFCITTIEGWQRENRQPILHKLVENCGLTRGWGDCYGHALVATGRADVMIDTGMNPWDAAAIWPILVEAGGHFSDWTGRPTIYGGNGVSVNAALKDQVLAYLQG